MIYIGGLLDNCQMDGYAEKAKHLFNSRFFNSTELCHTLDKVIQRLQPFSKCKSSDSDKGFKKTFSYSYFNLPFPHCFEKIYLKIQELAFSKANVFDDKKKNNCLRAIEKLKLTEAKLSKEVTKLEQSKFTPKIDKLKYELSKITKSIEQKQKIIDTIDSNHSKAIEARSYLQGIGGERSSIQTDHSVLDAMYMSVDRLRKTVKEAGGKTFSLHADELSFKGFIFDQSSYAASEIKTFFSGLGIDTADTMPCGWMTVPVQNNKILILSARDVEKLTAQNHLKDGHLSLPYEEQEIDLSNSSQAGTVILALGYEGVYEAYKYEITNLLLKGVNVMAFNYSGYGESRGNPSLADLKTNLESVYTHLQENYPLPDEKIMVKTLCMSGAGGAYLVSKHPRLHLFLDQTYSDFQVLVTRIFETKMLKYVDKIKNKTDMGKIRSFFIDTFSRQLLTLVKVVIKLAIPHWKVNEDIKKSEGQIAMLVTKEDELIDVNKHIYENYSAMVEAGKAQQVTVFAMKGQHGNSWYYVKEKPFSEKELEDHPDLAVNPKSQELYSSGHRNMDLFLDKINVRGNLFL